MTTRTQLTVGLAIGLVIGVVLGWLFRADPVVVSAAEPGTTLATTTTVSPVFVEEPWAPGGVRFRSTVLVPGGIFIEDGIAELAYTLGNLGPGLAASTEPPEAGVVPIDVMARPDVWELELASGAVIEGRSRPRATQVTFEVPDGTERTDVLAARVVQWRVPVPLGTDIDFELVAGASGEFADGTTVEVDFVLDQASSKIVEFGVQPSSDDEWFGAESLALLAADGGWRIAVQDRTRIQLIWEGADAPDRLTLVAGYPLWLPVDESLVVFEAGDR